MSKQKQTHDPLNVDEALNTSEAFLLKYKNLFIGVVVAIVVIVCGIVGYNHFIGEPNELKASEALFKGEQYFGNNEFELALNGDSLGYTGFLKIADEFSGTDAGNLANAYCGLCYAQLCRRLHGSSRYSGHNGQLLCTNGTIGQSSRYIIESGRQGKQHYPQPDIPAPSRTNPGKARQECRSCRCLQTNQNQIRDIIPSYDHR